MNSKKLNLIILFLFIGIYTVNAQSKSDILAWKYKANGKITGSAVIGENIIYFGSEDGVIHALNTIDGTPKWTKKTGGRISSKPAIYDSNLFILSGDGTLHKLSTNDGSTVWSFETEGPEERFKRYTATGNEFNDIWDYYLSSPTVHEGTVLFGSSDHHIYAVDTETGTLTWKYKTDNVVHSDPIVDNGIVYAGSFDGYMYALDIVTGSLIWKFDTVGAAHFPDGAVQGGASIYKGVVLFGSRDYNLYVLNKKTGKGFWNFKAESWVIGRPLVHEEKVYFGTSDSHLVYCKDIRDYRKLYWKTELPLRILGSPTAHKNRIFTGNFDGVLYGLNKETGEIEWQFKTDGHRKNYSAIFQKDGSFQPGFTIYGQSLAETRANDEKMMTLGSILGTPLIKNDSIYFGSTDSTFYAVSLPQ